MKRGDDDLATLNDNDLLRARDFLKKINGILATGEFTIATNEKNKEFDRQYNLTHAEKQKILRSLTLEDCVAFEPNDNSRYPDAEVFIFIKNCNICSYGQEENVDLYIKEYLIEGERKDSVIVISFHEEGKY